MQYLILLVMIFSLSLPISNFFKRKIETAIPISLIFIIILIYLTGLFDNLNLGVKIVQIVFIWTLFYNVLFIIKSIKTKTIKEEIKRIITPGLCIYIGLFLMLIIINHDRIFENYDEFNHWALIIKNMYITDAYGTIKNSIVTFNEYPPFTAIFQYLFLKISDIYSEDLIIFAQAVLYISMIIPICEKLDFEKNFKNVIIIVPGIIILPLIFYPNFFIEILVDGFLGVLFGIGMFLIYKKTDLYRNVLLIFILIALVLTKTTGLFLAIMLMIFKVIKMIRKKENIKFILFLIIIPMLFIGLWNFKINKTNAVREWDVKENNIDIVSDENKVDMTLEYIKAVLLREKFTDRKLSLLVSIGVISLLSIYIVKNLEEKKEFKIKLIELIISLIIFFIGLIFVYLNLFTLKEAEALASFERYLLTILLSIIIFDFCVLIYDFKVKRVDYYIFLVILLVFMPLQNIMLKYVDCRNYINISHTKRNFYTNISKYEKNFSSGDKVLFIIDRITNQKVIFKLNRYNSFGSNINIVDVDFDFIDDKEKINELLKEVDFVYIYLLKNKDVFENNEVSDRTLYKVFKNGDNNFKLEKINY